MMVRRVIVVVAVLLVSVQGAALAASGPGGSTLQQGFTPIALQVPQATVTQMSGLSTSDMWAVGITDDTSAAEPWFVEHWTGDGWSNVNVAPVQGASIWIDAVSDVSSADVWGVGASSTDGTNRQPLIEHWNGETWQVVPQPGTQGGLDAVAAGGPDNVWAVGEYGVAATTGSPYGSYDSVAEHWDGTSWSLLPTIDGVAFKGVAARPGGGMWAVGFVEDPTQGNGHAVIYRWDGASWTLDASPEAATTASYLNGIAMTTDGQAWAVGSHTTSSPQNEVSLIEHWDGSSWNEIPAPVIPDPSGTSPSPSDGLEAVSAINSSDVWASGGFVPPGQGGGHVLVEHWDGNVWSIVNAAQPVDQPTPAPQSSLFAVAATNDGGVWVGGSIENSVEIPLVEALHETEIANGGFSPQHSSSPVASGVAWRFTGTKPHEVKDASGMGIFDSGLRSPGASYTIQPPGAGTYPLSDPTDGQTASLAVSMSSTPISGGFYLRWGTDTLDSNSCGCYYDVEVAVPGSPVFVPFQPGVSTPGQGWGPITSGTYRFVSRYRQGIHSTGWSPVLTVTAP